MTWIHEPFTAYLSAQASEDSTSASGSRPKPWDGEYELCATSSGKVSPRPSSWRGWRARTWTRLLSGTISAPWTAGLGVESWISSLRESRANRTPKQGSVSGEPTVETSGAPPDGSCAIWEPAFSSWRMLPASNMATTHIWPGSRGSWPKTGGTRSGALFARNRVEPLIGEREPSCYPAIWPTSTVLDSRASGGRKKTAAKPDRTTIPGTSLTDAVREWPTPSTRDWKGPSPEGFLARRQGTQDLAAAASKWATPSARDWRDGRASPETLDHNSRPLNEQVVSMYPTPAASAYGRNAGGQNPGPPRPSLEQMARDEMLPGSSPQGPPTSTNGNSSSLPTPTLNPRFVEMLMGWPSGWTSPSRPTACARAATEWFRFKLLMHFALSGDG